MIIGHTAIRDVRSKEAFWQEFSNEVNGELKLRRTHDHVFNELKLLVEHNGIHFTFSESDTKPLNIQMNVHKMKTNLWFEIYEIDFIGRIMELFTSSVVKTANREFDRKYQIRSNNKTSMKLIMDKPIVNFMNSEQLLLIRGKATPMSFSINMTINREINSYERLKGIYEFCHHLAYNIQKSK
jgi:hypothetical protein